MSRLTPILLLVSLTSVLPELLSGNSPIEQMLGPEFLLYLVAYGLPVVLIREIGARRGTGLFGLFVMGIGYGLINEGLYARTIFRLSGVPVDTFDHYSYALGVNWGWAAGICVWHGVSAVMLPIALTNARHGAKPWFGPKILATLWVLTVLTATLFFVAVGLSDVETELGIVANEPVALVALWVSILGLWWIGARIGAKASTGKARRWVALTLGLAGLPAFVMAAIPSDAGWPVPTSFLVLALLIALYAFVIRRLNLGQPASIGWFALGWYGQLALFSGLALYATSPLTLAVDVVILGLLVRLALSLSAQK